MIAVPHVFRATYSAAFENYLAERTERELMAAYELGREAVTQDLSVLDLALVHHEVLRTTLAAAAQVEDAISAAGEFFAEALSAFEMVQRGYREAREAAASERQHAKMLRQLSNFLADASLAFGASESLEEVLHLVAEQTRELIGAECCIAALQAHADLPNTAAASHAPDALRWRAAIDPEDTTTLSAFARLARGPIRQTGSALSRHPALRKLPAKPSRSWLAAVMTALDGRQLGSIHLFDKVGGDFGEADEAVLVHVAQMASAAVERAELYKAVGRRAG
ncbi:MAG: GAF domain-containing protein [Actinomycetota bacterium]|nr:GAF domain-containing protein [Actinomycetota bacterium]